MTDRERRLRKRIDTVSDERDAALAELEKHRRHVNRCVYCGEKMRGRSRACRQHYDLLALDPYFAVPRDVLEVAAA